jgi:tetrahydromethanopterin S-methyltransferase subunit B
MNTLFDHTARLSALALACCVTGAIADTGSEKLDAQVAQLQQQISARHQLADDLLRNELALGYSVPEIAMVQSSAMVAKADDSAFSLAMSHLHKTMSLLAMLE